MFPITPEAIDKIISIFGEIFIKMGDLAQYGLEILMRKTIMDGILFLILFSIFTVIYIIALYWTKISTDPANSNSSIEECKEERAIFGSIFTIIWLIISSFPFYLGISRLIIPEFYVIMFLVDSIK